MHDVVLSARKHLSKLFAESEPQGHPRLRPVEVDRLASANSNDVRLGDSSLDVRGDDVDVMTEAARFAREEVNVFADAAEVWVVVLGDECDTKGTCETGGDAWKRRGRCEIYGTREVVTTR